MLKAARKKDQLTYEDRFIRITPDFSIMNLKDRKA